MGSISWPHQTIGNVSLILRMLAPGHNASRHCDIGGGPTLPGTQLSQASPTGPTLLKTTNICKHEFSLF